MVQQTANQPLPGKLAHPRRRDVFFHFIKTSKLVGALTTDRRVPVIRKILFFGIIAILVALLLVPDLFGEAVMSVIVPFVGTFLGVPLDAGFDWIALVLLAISLLRIFPAEILGEHYQRIFRE